MRIELFGNNRAFTPIHLGGGGALSSTHSTSDVSEDDDNDDNKANSTDCVDDADKIMVDYTLKGLYLGFVRTTQTHDSGGRAILFIDPSKLAGYNKNDENERLGVARALWYVMHNVFEGNDTVQRLGMIAL